jgi:hypothetical protein
MFWWGQDEQLLLFGSVNAEIRRSLFNFPSAKLGLYIHRLAVYTTEPQIPPWPVNSTFRLRAGSQMEMKSPGSNSVTHPAIEKGCLNWFNCQLRTWYKLALPSPDSFSLFPLPLCLTAFPGQSGEACVRFWQQGKSKAPISLLIHTHQINRIVLK